MKYNNMENIFFNLTTSNLKRDDGYRLFDLSNTRISSHLYENMLLRFGMDRKETDWTIRNKKFRKINRYDKIVNRHKHMINRFNKYPKQEQWVRESDNMLIIIGKDDMGVYEKCIINVLYIDNEMYSKYKKYH